MSRRQRIMFPRTTVLRRESTDGKVCYSYPSCIVLGDYKILRGVHCGKQMATEA